MRFSKVRRAKSTSLGAILWGQWIHTVLLESWHLWNVQRHGKVSGLSFSGDFSLQQTKMPQTLCTNFSQPFGGCLDYEVSSARFCALAFGWVKVGQACLPLTKHPREWQLYLDFFHHAHRHTQACTLSLACGQCTDVITDIPGCYLFFITQKDAFDTTLP